MLEALSLRVGICTLPISRYESERTVDVLAPQSFQGIYTAFLDRAEQHPDKPAFELKDGRHITYHDLLTDAQRIAHLLTRAGVQPGDRVACQVKKSVRAVAAYLAVLQIGGIY
ncbi:hypothetical protein PY02_00490, partial [Staphylococcus aureus]